MLKVLFIDDQRESIETLIEKIKDEIEVTEKISGFDEAESVLRCFTPDIVILDIFRGSAVPNGDTPGLKNFKFIWDKCFCPIVVYSARPDDIGGQIEDHPFVKRVQKGSGSESKVVSYIQEFIPHVEVLNRVENDIRQHVNREVRIIAPLVFANITDDEKRRAVFGRAVRRRVAAMMDEPFGEIIACWEQYLYPAAGSHLLTGDIIKRSGTTQTDPADHYIVLTPSCDLVSSGTRKPKVDEVLTARCTDVDEILSDISANSNTDRDKLTDKIRSFLTRGFGYTYLALPELPGVIPAMMANLKNLELIKLNKIGNDNHSQYCRIVSVDSPFREMVTWAYIQIAGRPGLPNRNFDRWAEEICSAVQVPPKKV